MQTFTPDSPRPSQNPATPSAMPPRLAPDPFLDESPATKDNRPVLILAGAIGGGCLLIAVGLMVSRMGSPASAPAPAPQTSFLTEQQQVMREAMQMAKQAQQMQRERMELMRREMERGEEMPASAEASSGRD